MVLPLEPVQAIGLATDVACKERLVQNVGDALLLDLTVFAAREIGMDFKEPFYFRLRLEAPRSKAFKGVAHEAGQWFVSDQQLAMSFHGLVAIAHRGVVHPVP
ncbi:hypothetical protein AN476_07555 [Phaeobacter sp. 11ANDIMAR09]|nr:hypothetical protein [Phaeobacter sp. 11ANDIMAR09]KPD13139.1 hypothetical protein AN476_07555 [Phaeobacter sp. 11ANDIMAR09]